MLASSLVVFILTNIYNNNTNYLFIISTNNQYFLSNYIQLVLYIDFFSANFISLTALLASIIILYSLNYMKDDQYINSFVLFITFFAISMITLLSSGNFFTFVLG